MKLALPIAIIIIVSGLSYLGIADLEKYSLDSSSSFSFVKAIININNGQLLTYITMIISFIVFAIITLKLKFTEKFSNIMLLLSTSVLIVAITVFTTKVNWINESEMKPEEVRMSLQLLFLLFLSFQLILIGFLIVGAIKTGELFGKQNKKHIA